MSEVRHDDILRKLPKSPYPGLRPFLDHEEMLMFGREKQLAQILRRLRASRFVAIVGGSGSGKSSLVRAGLVPHLRRYGIPEVGDLWLPVVCTPGTNSSRRVDGTSMRTPLDRFADRFERCLRGENPGRRADIAALLRRPGGLARLVEAYEQDFDLPHGVRPSSAQVLFVIDQFEEVFDQSNMGEPDARHLVERVIDHFHIARNCGGEGIAGRCFVVLTMRSEHLSDCATFIGLPEAINSGGYLMSRLDEPQLKDVIVKPAQRFLRLRQRLDPDCASLPPAVEFDPEVVVRLLRDTAAIAHDPDHLPLLQHVLARTWEAACRREGLDRDGIPARINLADLREATTAGRASADHAQRGSSGAPAGQDDRSHENLLRASLENWAELIFSQHNATQQAALESVLRRLAFRDPATSAYSQQRINATEYGKEALWALVKDGFVGKVNYLFWDDENSEHITVKISHESFIRGWSRFRRLIDDESARFERFVDILDEYREWERNERTPAYLLSTKDVQRVREAKITEALTQPALWNQWLRLLGHLPGGEMDDVDPGQLAAFIRDSERAKRRAHTRRTRRRWLTGLGVACVPLVLFTLLIQKPIVERGQRYVDASELGNVARNDERQASVGAAAPDLRLLVDAAKLMQQGQTGEGILFAATSDRLLGSSLMSNLKSAAVLPSASRSVDVFLNMKLRTTLTGAIWNAGDHSSHKDKTSLIDDSAALPERVECGGKPGTLLPVGGRRESDPVKRGLFFADDAVGTELGRGNRLLFSATVSAGPKGCTLGRQLFALPLDRDPAVVFDATLRYMLLATKGDAGQTPTVSLHRIQWGDPAVGDCASIDFPRVTLTDPRVEEVVRRQSNRVLAQAAATWRMPGGRGIRISNDSENDNWWIITGSATSLVPKPSDSDLRPLVEERDGGVCRHVEPTIQADLKARGLSSHRTVIYRERNYCLAISRGLPPDLAGVSMETPGCGGRSSEREQVALDVYFLPKPPAAPDVRQQRQTRLTSFEFGRMGLSEVAWHVGAPGSPYEGWLVLKRSDERGTRYVGAPWSTAALMQLSEQVLAVQQEREGEKPMMSAELN